MKGQARDICQIAFVVVFVITFALQLATLFLFSSANGFPLQLLRLKKIWIESAYNVKLVFWREKILKQRHLLCYTVTNLWMWNLKEVSNLAYINISHRKPGKRMNILNRCWWYRYFNYPISVSDSLRFLVGGNNV